MRLAVGSDERLYLPIQVVKWLKKKGHTVTLYGALKGETDSWVKVGCEVAESVISGKSQEGILFCWTGTGISMAANKVPGIRAALCSDSETAVGAKKWNHANVLVMSSRLTSFPVAEEILKAWLNTGYGKEESKTVKYLAEMEKKYVKKN